MRWWKGKGKGHPITGHKGPDVEYRYSSTLSLISALDGVGVQLHAPAALPIGKTLLYLNNNEAWCMYSWSSA